MAFPEHLDVECVDTRGFQTDVRRDLADRIHLRQTRCENQTLRGEIGGVALLRVDHPVLLAVGVGVVRADLQAGLDHRMAPPGERPDRVENDVRTAERLDESGKRVFDLDDVVIDRLDPRHRLHDRLEAAVIAACGEERDVVFA